MSKLVVEVVDAYDLMPKDDQGSSSPFVEVEFDGQHQRTQTKHKDLNPSWHESLVFDINQPGDLEYKTIDVTVYNDRKGNHGHHRNFLGRVKISGASVPSSESGSSVQHYPLDKRGLFSNIKGEIALKLYQVRDELPREQVQRAVPASAVAENEETGRFQESQFNETPFQEINGGRVQESQFQETPFQDINNVNNFAEEIKVEEKKKKKKNEPEVRTFHSIGKEPEVRTFHSVGTGTGGPPPAPPPMSEKPPAVEIRADFAKAAAPAASVMHMQMPRQNPDYLLVETRPPVAARLRYRGGDKTLTTYDLVEQMHYLYVNVVKAKDLPVMDMSGSLDPYVEVKLGNYKGQTKHLEKNQNPVWHQIFAFSKERVQSNLLEVVVKDKDFGKDDFVGKIVFDVMEIPLRAPPDSPLAPQWYRLADKKGDKVKGEIMLAVWMGTQADESFPEAWHSDAHNISHSNLANTRSKVYFSPKLYYLRVHVMEAQDLVPHDKGRLPDPYVKVVLGNQIRPTKVIQRTIHPVWDDQLMFVASEPFEDYIIISVDDRIGPGKDEILGRAMIPVREVPQRLETGKPPDPRWFNLLKHSKAEEESEKKKEKFSSKILLRIFLEAGYHVLDESTHFSSDLQPSSKFLRKQSIGILELGILSAKNLQPMKMKDGKLTDAYCVAKYGNKWVRTRTLLDTLSPRWNEQYTWEVHDPCTVITIGVFDNSHTNGSKDDARDQRIGKVRVRLSTLEIDRVYTHYYPLLVLTPGGLKKNGELQLALRFTCTAWVNMVAQYGRPLLPKMHYVQPIPVMNIDWLRHQAMQIVAARLQRAEPPLRREVVEYMLDVDYHMWSLRRSKANFNRIISLLSGTKTSPHMDARLSQADRTHPDELDEEFDSFPTSRPSDIVRMRYDRLRSVAGRVQTVVGDLASQGERAQAILSWRDPRATAIFIIFSLIWAVFIYVTPFQVVAVLFGLYWLRHPRFRSKLPSVPVNFFKRLPSKSDMLI